jgi:aspartate aminotransferase-like enzyme
MSETLGRFFLPGPTEVRAEVLDAMDRQVIGHRGRELSDLLEDAGPRLCRVFGTERPVYISTSSATGLMEGGIRNGVRSRALSLVNGAFSSRFRDLVADCGREGESYEVPWGEAHDPALVEEKLAAGDFDALTVVHSETSTGVLNPVAEIAAAARRVEERTGREIMVMVDGVTSVAAMEVDADGWGIDWYLTGSQKALALPPGLAFGTPSERMLRKAATLPGRGQYFDLLEFDRYWKKHQTPTTPAVNLLYALVAQLRHIDEETMPGRASRHWAMAERCWEWVGSTGARWGLSVLAPEERRSPTVTTIRLPEGLTGPEVAGRLKRRGWTIGAGYGKLKDSTIRIGHMGDHTVEGLEALLAVLAEELDG